MDNTRSTSHFRIIPPQNKTVLAPQLYFHFQTRRTKLKDRALAFDQAYDSADSLDFATA